MLTVLMPSRGRPAQAKEALDSLDATSILRTTGMIAVLDEGEPGYHEMVTMHVEHEGGMGPALNAAAELILMDDPPPSIIGFVGDDHRFRTWGWDQEITQINDLMGGGIIYGNDLLKGEALPTAVFMDARIVKALGWMALPGAKHLFLDDTWRELGNALGRLKYLPDVVIEHMHPTVGKAEWDEGYRRVNEGALYDHDGSIYHDWLANGLAEDVARVNAALR